MIRAIFRGGVVYPTAPIPSEWRDGREVWIRGADESPGEEFGRLSAEWKEDTRYVSSVTEIATHAAYQHIIGLGAEMVPLILRDLQQEPHQWFWALRAITGEDPVPLSAKGKVREMAEAWIQWGRGRGLIANDVSGE